MEPPSGRERWERICAGLTFANDEVGAWPVDAVLDARPGLGGQIAVCRYSWENNTVTVSVGGPQDLQALVNGPTDAAALAAEQAVTFEPFDSGSEASVEVLGWGRGPQLAVKVSVVGDTVEPEKVAAVFDAALER